MSRKTIATLLPLQFGSGINSVLRLVHILAVLCLFHMY